MMKKFEIFLLSVLFIIPYSLFIAPGTALAHCPLCVAGAAVGVSLSRYIGVDDSITGVWLAAFLGAISFWTSTWLTRKVSFKKQVKAIVKPLVYMAIFALTIWSFYKYQLVIRMSQIMGLDKLTFGMLSGGVLFYAVDALDDYLIKRNGRVFFPYQRIIVSLGSILAFSLVLYVLLNYYI